MANETPKAASPATRCPNCEQQPDTTLLTLKGPQATANHLCENGHIWAVTWLIDPPPLLAAS